MTPALVHWPWEKLKAELEPFIKKEGRLPPKRYFERIKRGDLIVGINKNGGFKAVREKLGEPQLNRTGSRSLRHWENAKKRLEELDFPPWHKLSEIDSGLTTAITKYHGGYPAVKRKCNKAVQIGRGLKKWENLEPLLQRIMDDHGGDLPPIPVIRDSEDPVYKAVYRAIYDHHEGVCEVRSRLGLKLKIYSGKYSLRHRENLDAVLLPLVKKLGYFPSVPKLNSMKLTRIIAACEIYHGGIEAVQQAYGYPPRTKRYARSLRHWDNLREELEEIILLIGRFPTVTDFEKLNKDGVYRAMNQHHCGIKAVRRKFGAKSPCRRGLDSLRWWDNFLEGLLPIVKQFGHFPSYEELKSSGRGDLADGSKHHGGLKKIRKRFEEMVEKNEIRLEDIHVPAPEPVQDLVPHSVRLLDLLRFYGVEPRQISDNIARDSDGSYFLIVSPFYSEVVRPVPLQTGEGVFSLESQHAWLVSLFIQLSSNNPVLKRGAIKKTETIAESELTSEKALPALTLLRNMFLVEQDKGIEREMDAVLGKPRFRDMWKRFGS